MRITKAVITAAGRGARQFPAFDAVQKAMTPLVDRDGLAKPVLQVIAEEAIEAGIEEICVVSAPEDETYYRRHFESFAANLRANPGGSAEQAQRMEEVAGRLRFAVQAEPLGYGHAVWTARDFAADQPVLLLLGDHVYISREGRRCARQLMDLAASEGCAVSAVQSTREHLIGQYGTIGGRRLPDQEGIYQIDEILEKPNPTLAELRLQIPGLKAGHYLCFFGMHVVTSTVFDLLGAIIREDRRELGSIQLTTALDELARRERYLALETRGARYNLGTRFGVVEAQIALALAGVDRDRMLTTLLESVVRVEQGAG